MFWAMKVHQQEVSCRMQALWYNVNAQVYIVLWLITNVYYI